MTASTVPHAFISYSQVDRECAEEISSRLRAEGVDAFFDRWEIQPGDSLIQRIFEQGLKDCDVFVILLSPSSVASSWVKSELDAALIGRMAGATRVVPVVVTTCDIPVALRALMRLDLTTQDLETVIHSLADVAYGRSAKPPVGTPRDRDFPERVRGLSRDAAAIAAMLVGAWGEQGASSYQASTVAEFFKFSVLQLNDAADELEAKGLAKLHRYLGTAPYSFAVIQPTYILPLFLQEAGASNLNYDPLRDIIEIVAAVAASEAIDGPQLLEQLKLSPWRVNNAVEYLDDHGIVQVLRALGTSPFAFMSLQATPATRRFATEHAK